MIFIAVPWPKDDNLFLPYAKSAGQFDLLEERFGIVVLKVFGEHDAVLDGQTKE